MWHRRRCVARAGDALLSRALAWAGGRGFSHCALHYHAADPSGGPFWRKHGFEAVQYAMIPRRRARLLGLLVDLTMSASSSGGSA